MKFHKHYIVNIPLIANLLKIAILTTVSSHHYCRTPRNDNKYYIIVDLLNVTIPSIFSSNDYFEYPTRNSNTS